MSSRLIQVKLLAQGAVLGGVLACSVPQAAQSAPPLTEQQAHAIAVDAYIYLYSLLSINVTRQQSTNVDAGKEIGKGPPNVFVNVAEYPPGDYKGVVRVNFDTLYSLAWLDLTKEPMIVSAPDTQGRYYMLPMLDMWTDVFAAPGWRTTGTEAASWAVVPPGWTGELPAGVAQIDAPTPIVWVIGRTKTDGQVDYEAVHKIQAGYKITPLSQWGKPAQPVVAKIDPSIDMKTPPKVQVDSMEVGRYFATAAEFMKTQPPHITDQPMIAQLHKLGFDPGKSFDLTKADPVVQKAMVGVREDAQRLMAWKLKSLARIENGWQMNTDTMGVYGNFYLKRALVSQLGLGANLPEDAIYPLNLFDGSGKPLDGSHRYTIHFEKGATPPVAAFWSITLYDGQGFQVPNALNRFAASSWMPFKFNGDGSLDLYFQNDSPGPALEANWLPAPKGAFNLTMRLYSPDSTALTGQWNPPPVVEESSAVATLGQ